jgi:predicted CXXCH cytochrome family protein
MVRSRWRAESSPSQHGAPAPALRRRSAWLVSLVALLAAVLILVPGFAPVARSLREPLLPRARTLPLDFPHARHVAVNCIACHHNYTDGRGLDTCVSCHRSGRADLQRGAEARFHDFCLGCHRARHDRDRHGPVAACAACHGARRPAT